MQRPGTFLSPLLFHPHLLYIGHSRQWWKYYLNYCYSDKYEWEMLFDNKKYILYCSVSQYLEYSIIQSRYDGHWIQYSLRENGYHFVAAQAHQAAHQATSAHCIDRSNGRSDSYRANAFPYLWTEWNWTFPTVRNRLTWIANCHALDTICIRKASRIFHLSSSIINTFTCNFIQDKSLQSLY